MKKTILSVSLAIACFAGKAQSPIANNGFENWNTLSYENPKFYSSSNDEEFARGKIGSPNVTKVKSPQSQSGTYAIRMETVASANDTAFGYFANGDPGQNNGGVPYAERPTMLTGYYKGTFMPGDSAIVLVVFKKNGSTISMDVKKIGMSQANYTAFSMPINLPPVFPDTVIVAAASSDALADKKGTPGTFVYFDNFVFTGVASQPADMNGDFEMWDNYTLDILADWYVNGGDGGGIKTSDKHNGMFAIELETRYNEYDGKAYGSMVSNALWVGNGPNGHYFGQPYTLTKDTLCGWYKYIPNSVDSASVMVSLTNMGLGVGGAWQGLPPVGTYTYFEIPFMAGAAPDSIQVSLSSSYNNTTLANIGSQLFLDDLYLKSQFVNVSATTTNITCHNAANGLISASATGGIAPYTFMWNTGDVSPGVSNLPPGTYTVTVTDAVGITTTAAYSITQPAIITATVTPVNATCGGSDGSVSVVAGGGTGAFTYSWSSGATSITTTGLNAGSYDVTVTDANNCTQVVGTIINNSGAATISSVSTSPVSCNGGSNGSAVANATGGTGTLTYSWSNGTSGKTISAVSAGTYIISVTDGSGCLTQSIATVTQPTALSVSTTSGGVNCFGGSTGSAMASGSGGTGILAYSWSNSASGAFQTGLSATSYTVTVTDANACKATTSVTITQPTQVTISVSSGSSTCFNSNDGYAIASGFGGVGIYGYSWSNGSFNSSVTGLAAGTYTVTVSDFSSCKATTTVSITEPTAIVVNASVVANIACNGGSTGSAMTIPTGGTGAFQYTWSSGSTVATAGGLAAATYTVTVIDANMCMAISAVTITQPSVINPNATVVANISCFGGSNGSITATPTGGTGSYTYSWSSGSTVATVNGLIAGGYIVTVKDINNCSATTSVTITAPSVITANATVVANVSCFGGSNASLAVTPTGGTGAFTYSWSTTATGQTLSAVSAGTYTVTVIDANGCSTITSSSVTEPATVLTSAITAASNATCLGSGNDGSATVTANGGTPGYIYLWSNNGSTATISALSVGVYSVTVNDANGCNSTTSVTITSPATYTVTPTVTDVVCHGQANGSVDLTISGSNAYTYVWSTGATTKTVTNLAAGTYTVTVDDENNCPTVKTITVSEPTPLTATASSTGNNASVSASGGTPNYTYSWSSGGTGSAETILIIGTYTVTVTDANNCSATSTVMITVTGIGTNASNGSDITLYPNPANTMLYVSAKFNSNASSILTIRNVIGEVVMSTEVKQAQQLYQFNVNELPVGIYSLEMLQGDVRSTRKFTKLY